MDIQNKTALVTGGAVRLGRAICLELAAAGANIFCQYHSSEKEALSLKEAVESLGRKIEIFKIDLTETNAAKEISRAIQKTMGSIDILVNNSALFYPTPLGQATEEDWDTFHNLNLKAAFFLCQEVGLLMKKQGSGRIVNIGDTSVESPWTDYIPYILSKSGIVTMTKGLAKALAPDVLVNCINPGPVLFPSHYTEQQKARSVKRTLLQRAGSAEDIARTARFLVETDYITGAVIPVDGGRHIG
jgi:pteridine reductase